MASLAGKTGKSKALEEWRAQRTRGEYSMEVSLLYSALRSFKKTSVVNPFPKDFVVAGVRDYGRVTQAICRLPSAAVVYGDASALPTVSVDEEKLLAFMLENANLKEISDMDEVMRHVPGHDPVYIPQRAFAVQHDAQRNKEFEAAAEQYPPKVAFHGSPIGNWFSIGKTGLRNLNGLHKPAHGSLFGEGIYMSKTLRLASDFSSSGDSWGLSDLGGHLRVVAMCEWIPTPETRSGETNSTTEGGGRIPDAYIVIDNAAHVRLKALLVYVSSPKATLKKGLTSKLSSLWAVFFYILVLVLLVMVQSENRLWFRSVWKQSERQWKQIMRAWMK